MFKIFRFGLLSSIKFTKFSQNFKKLNEFTIFPFAKVGKKKQEKIQKEKSKESAQLSDEIDLSPIEEKMKLEVDTYKDQLSKLKAGRLSPDIFNKFIVNAYGEKTPLSELAQIMPKTANSIVLNVFDEKLVPDVMKILENSDMNFQLKKEDKSITCIVTGGNTKEIKNNLIKEAKELLEGFRTKIRKHRSHGLETVIKPYKKFASEDIVKEAEKEIQTMFKKYETKIEEILKDKEKELLK